MKGGVLVMVEGRRWRVEKYMIEEEWGKAECL